MASTHHGVVYTKKWVVDLILDVAGYVPGTGISDKVIIEPSCGCGAFLTVIAGRLADDAIAVGKGWTSLVNAIRAYDIDSASIETARKAAVEALMTRGCHAIQARELCEQWIVHGDFILDDIPAADFIVGNPPYVRAVEIDRTKRSLYVKRLSSVTTGCDLYVSFFDRGLDTLKVGGTLCFICADRWLQNKYGTSRIRALSSSGVIGAPLGKAASRLRSSRFSLARFICRLASSSVSWAVCRRAASCCTCRLYSSSSSNSPMRVLICEICSSSILKNPCGCNRS